MANPFVGEIRMFGGNFAPQGWAFCDGQLMAISENETLFQLIGTTYGGDGQSTFGLPDLRGRVPLHQGNSFVIGQLAGTESVTLTTQQIPAHTHAARASNVGTQASPIGGFWSTDPGGNNAAYSNTSNSAMNAQAIKVAGGSQPHENRQPVLAISFIISLFGIFPTQN